jgi:hypothetical protein
MVVTVVGGPLVPVVALVPDVPDVPDVPLVVLDVVPVVPVVPVVAPPVVLVDVPPRRSSSICAVIRAIAALSAWPDALIDAVVWLVLPVVWLLVLVPVGSLVELAG